MSTFTHTPARDIVLKETTEDMLKEVGIDHLVEPVTPVPVPSRFTIRNEMTAVEDQGNLGTCTSFCVTALLEHLHRVDLSEAQITHEAEKRYGDCKAGLALAHGMAQAREPGVGAEPVWPYDNVQICWNSPPSTGGKPRFRFRSVAAVYQVPRVSLLADIASANTDFQTPIKKSDRVKQQLVARRRPVAMSVPVFWRAGWSMGPDITMPSAAMMEEFAQLASPKVDGWHCIAICGYDNTTGRFTFKNSWNTWWGDGGYGTLPYQYVERFSDLSMIGW